MHGPHPRSVRSSATAAASVGLVLLAGLAVLVMAPSDARAQAWIHDPGGGYAELSYRTISGDSFYGSEGDVRAIRSRYTQRTVQLYGEVGLVPRWLQLTLDGEVFRYNELADQGATSGLGDTSVGLWTGLYQQDARLSAGLEVGIPTGDPDPSAPGDDPQAEIIAASLPTGDGAFDLTPQLALGYSHVGSDFALHTYVTGTAGYQIRFADQRDAVEWRFEAGIKFPVVVLDRIWFALRVRGLHPLGDGDRSSFSGLGSGAAYVSPGASISVEVYEGFGIRSSVEGAVYARSIVAAVPFQIGLYYDF